MAMSFGSADSGDGDVMSEMNTTPLIDVMLVLLVMLIITIPAQLHSVDINMPRGNPPPAAVKPEVVRLDINADGRVLWNGEFVEDDTLPNKLALSAAQAIQPELHVRPNRSVEYRKVVFVMAAIQRAGLAKIGIIGGEQFL